MKSRFFTSLLASIALVLGVGNTQAQTVMWTGEAPVSGTNYYMKNVGTGKYANGIDATVDAITNAKAFAFTGSNNNWKIAGVSYTTSLTRDYAISSTETNAWKNYSVTANGPFVFYTEKTAVFDDNYFFHLTQNVNFSYGSAGIPRKVVTDDINYQWNLISQDQYNAVYPTSVSGKAVSRTYESYENAVSTEKDGGIWLAKVATSRTGDYLATEISGLTNGYYYVTVSAKKDGSGAATVDVYNGASKYSSEELSKTVNSYKILVYVTGGTATVKFNAGANVTNIAAAVTGIESFTVAANGSVDGRWVPEAPADGLFYIYHVNQKKYLTANSTALNPIGTSSVFTVTGANSGQIYSGSFYLRNNKTIWSTNKNQAATWTFAGNSNMQYTIKNGNNNYIRYGNTGVEYSTVTSNNLWQFISQAQYYAIYPQTKIRTMPNMGSVNVTDFSANGNYTELEGTTWLAKANATAAGDYLKLTISGLTAGDIYTFDIDAKHLAASSALGTLYVKSGSNVATAKLSGALKSYKLSVVADASKTIDIYIKTTVANSGYVYLAIKNIAKTEMPKPVAFTVSGWTEVTSLTSVALKNPEQYFFSIWSDANTCLTLGNGTNGCQGSGYKTMKYEAGVNPDNVKTNLAALWEFYKVSDGKYAIANASDREHILQAENGGLYRYADNTPINVAKATMTLAKSTSYNNWNFQASDGKYLTRWGSYNDVQLDAVFSYYKIYAISRADYYALTQKIKYNATTLTPIDVSLFIANPEGLGTSGDGSTMLGWTRDCTLATYEDDKYAEKSGKSYFGYYSKDMINGQPKGKMYQTISGLPAGYYVLSVKTDDPQTGVNLYMGSFSEALTSSIDNEVSVSGSVATDGGSLTFGIQLEDYQPHVDSKDQPDYYQLMFDKFVLKYYGTDEVLAETVGEGEYYIRTNIGTDANPEYRYLEAGGNSTWGTEPVIGDHGFAYKLEKNGTKAGGVQLYALNSFIKEKTASQYFNGYFNDRNKDRSLISFIPVDAVNNPLDYRIYTERNVISDGTVCEAGYLYPKNNNTELGVKADNSGATVWQVVNELQRIKEMSNASMSNPVDATFFIKDPDFSRNDTRSGYWKVGNNAADTLKHTNDTQYAADYSTTVGGVKFVKGDNGQNNTNFNVKIQANKGAFDLRQKIQSVNLPTGIYRISAQGAAGNGGNVTLYAADGSGNELGSVAFDVHGFGSNKAAADEFNMGSYKKTIEVVVKENGLTIGFRGTTQTATSYVDNVEMEYLGEKPIDPADLTDEREVYIYNVEAGAFLTQTATGNYAIVGTTGYLWTIQPKDGEAGKIAIKHGGMYLVPSNTTSTAIGLQTMVKEGDPYYWTATVDPVNPNCLVIKDEMGRLLEWNGDKAYNVLSGTSADVEPRGTRWQLYTASQYGKDRAFASTASASRLANWPVVRAARVNIKNLVGDNSIEGLSDSYTAMDAVWQNIHSSSSQIASAANEVKARIVAAQNAKKGDVRNPIDVSFLIYNANLGEGTSKESVATGWTVESGAWSAVPRAETIYPNKKDMINIGRFLWATSASVLSQTVSNLPSGTYKLAVDVRGRTKPSVYSVTLVPSVSNGSDGREGTFSESSSITFGIKEVVTKYVVIKDDDASKDLKIRFALESGSVAFDNFRLLYCGKVTDEGDFRLITVNDNTEIELQGTWDITKNPELGNDYSALKDALSTNDIGAIHVYNENATIIGDLDLYNNYIKGTNTVVYTDVNNVVGDANVIRRKKIDTADGEEVTYSCANLFLTYKQGVTFLSIPYGFKADNVTFNRAVDMSVDPYKTDGFQWTNIVVPFDITSRPTGIVNFYKPLSLVDWKSGKTTLRVVQMNEDGTLEHNTPALIKADGNITLTEKNAFVYPTSELEKPVPNKPGMNLFGNYTKKYVVGGDATLGNDKNNPKDIPNADGLHANMGYYTNSNKFKNGNGWFNVGAFQAFIYDGSSYDSSAGVRRGGMSFDIEEWFNTEITKIADVEDEEVKVEAYYSVNGIRLDSPQKGVNIVKFSNGMKKKIFIK